MKTLYLIMTMTITYQLIIMKMMMHKLAFMTLKMNYQLTIIYILKTLKMNYQVTMIYILKILLMKMIQILKLNIAQE